MRTVFQAIAEDIEIRNDGKLNILGLIEQIEAPNYPARTNVAIIARFEISADEFGKEVTVEVRIVTPDGKGGIIIRDEGKILPTGEPGRLKYWDYVQRFQNLDFPTSGPYEFVYRIDGEILAEIPVWAVET